MKYYVLFNPLAGNGKCAENGKGLNLSAETLYFNITAITDYGEFLGKLEPDSKIVICGGDGTLNRFINAVKNIEYPNDVLYIAAGSGNDFLNDLGLPKNGEPIPVKEYFKNLPEITVKGKTYSFINGIGFGIDGYCCEERDRKQQKNNKPVNYTLIALKGLIYAFKPRKATVTVDGREYKYERVWMAPTMFGRYFGGGMMVTPTQDRKNEKGTVTVFIGHNLSKLKIIYLFPLIFKGKHISHTEYVAMHEGFDITVRFDTPCALQIDGETVLDVTEYSVKAGKKVKEEITA